MGKSLYIFSCFSLFDHVGSLSTNNNQDKRINEKKVERSRSTCVSLEAHVFHFRAPFCTCPTTPTLFFMCKCLTNFWCKTGIGLVLVSMKCISSKSFLKPMALVSVYYFVMETSSFSSFSLFYMKTL